MANFKIFLEASVEMSEQDHDGLKRLLAFHGLSLDEFLFDAMQAQGRMLENLRIEHLKQFREGCEEPGKNERSKDECGSTSEESIGGFDTMSMLFDDG